MASKTGWTSVRDWLITRRISAGAVCRSRASVRSRLRASSSEQAHVFDGDDRLIGEGPDEVDLALAEGPGLGPPHEDHPEQAVALQHGHGQEGAIVERAPARLARRIRRQLEHVAEVRPPSLHGR